MNNLRKMESIAKRKGAVHPTRQTMEDMDLWLEFLKSAKEGISINRIVFRKPTLISYSDSCELGIGGFSPFTGIGWRYKFSEAEAKAFTLNLKEYIGAAVDTAMQSRNDPSTCPFPCYLNMSDSTSTVGWLKKSNHDPHEAPIHAEVARFQARTIMKINACTYSQHLPGKMNVVTDSLSRDFHLSNEQLISMLTSLHPSLSPTQIKIIDLPDDLTSWISSLAQRWPGERELPKERITSEIAAGIIGWDSSTESSSPTTPIWRTSTTPKRFESAVLSCMQCEEVTLGERDEGSKSNQPLPDRPSIMWQRPLWKVVGAAPSSTPGGRRTTTLPGRPKVTRRMTQQPSTKRPSRQ